MQQKHELIGKFRYASSIFFTQNIVLKLTGSSKSVSVQDVDIEPGAGDVGVDLFLMLHAVAKFYEVFRPEVSERGHLFCLNILGSHEELHLL